MATVAVMLDDKQAEAIRVHMKVARTIWMLSERRPLNRTEREMLMSAIEYVEGVIDPDVDYEGEAEAGKDT